MNLKTLFVIIGVIFFGGFLLHLEQDLQVSKDSIATLNLQMVQNQYIFTEHCAEDANRWFKDKESDVNDYEVMHTTEHQYYNHYNAKAGKCYAVYQHSDLDIKKGCILKTYTLVDVNENKEIAEYSRVCTDRGEFKDAGMSLYKFEQASKSYMED